MKTLTIVGNGFDMGHGLPTSFDAFIRSNPAVLEPKYEIFKGDDGTWREVEKNTKISFVLFLKEEAGTMLPRLLMELFPITVLMNMGKSIITITHLMPLKKRLKKSNRGFYC